MHLIGFTTGIAGALNNALFRRLNIVAVVLWTVACYFVSLFYIQCSVNVFHSVHSGSDPHVENKKGGIGD